MDNQIRLGYKASFYLVRICIEDRITDLPWNCEKQLEIGGLETDDYQLPMKDADVFHLTLTLHKSLPVAICQDGSSKKLLELYDGLWIIPSSLSDIAVCVFAVPEETLTTVSLEPGTELLLGRARSSGLPLPHRSISKSHAVISRGTCYQIRDLQSSLGTYVNGKRIERQELRAGDVITIGIYHLLFDGEYFYVTSCLIAQQKECPVCEFQRAPRCINQIPHREIQLEKPPAVQGTPKINWLTVMIMPIITIALMAILSMTMGMNSYMFLVSGIMSFVSAVSAVISYCSQKKAHKKQLTAVEEKYRAYLASVSAQLERDHQLQCHTLRKDNPSYEEQLKIVEKRTQHLWERMPMDADFGTVRIGTGTQAAAVYAVYQQPQIVLEESVLEQEAKELAAGSNLLSELPVLCPLVSEGLVGIVGDASQSRRLIYSMLTALATNHAPGEWKLVLLVPQNELYLWSWARWLPHLRSETGETVMLCDNADTAETVLTSLEESLQMRSAAQKQNGSPDPASQVPHYLFISVSHGWLEQHGISKFLFSEVRPGCSALFVRPRLELLPKECKKILELRGEEGIAYSRLNVSQRTAFQPDGISVEQAEKLARCMASIPVEFGTQSASLPSSVSFLEGYGVEEVQGLNIGARWKKAKTYKSLSVPIAAKAGGGTFYFDIHEKRHGVNGIVAGMPGSGKTEMVQTWLLSLAVNYSPEDVNFVLVDFKGSGMIAPFRTLPHLAGTISNLDTSIQRNLIALQNEVHRREALLDRYTHVLNKPEINYLNEAYAQGLVPERLPVLLIAIDEYAEFKKIFPDFGAEIDSLTSKGRGLGIFVILMTQKPAGVVSAKSEDNIRFRWCLRVANYAASREMIGRSDAANIRTPGRAFVKVGENDVFEEVQSFWSGAPYSPDHGQKTCDFPPICLVSETGVRTPCIEAAKEEKPAAHMAQNKAVVSYIAGYCRENNIPQAQKIWMERLPERLAIEPLLQEQFDGGKWPEAKIQSGIGLLDDPYHQRQIPLMLDWEKNGHVLIYGAPQTGKTTLLKTLLVSLALTRKPDDISIYIMDFGGWNLNLFRAMPHVGGVANDQDPERLQKLTLLLRDMLSERKAAFAHAGVGNIRAYREVTRQDIPDVLLVVDHISAALKLYPELDGFFSDYTSSGANYGLYLAATAAAANAVPMKIAQNIKYILALQMIDKSDYTYLVGKAPSQLPAVMGRGYAKGTPPLEFQTALPVDGSDQEVSSYIERLAQQMSAAWNGRRPAPIPILPEVIPYGSVSCDGLCLGLSTERVTPVGYDWKKQHYLLISGMEQSGKSNLLQVLAQQMKYAHGASLVAFDICRSGLHVLRPLCREYLTEAAEMDDALQRMRPELQRRQQEKACSPQASFPPLVLVLDDYVQLFQAISNESAMRLQAMVKLAAGLDVYLLVAADAFGFASLVNKGEEVALALSKGKTVVALGGCLNDHGGISVKANYAQKCIAVKEREGFLIQNDEVTTFLAMDAKGEPQNAAQ